MDGLPPAQRRWAVLTIMIGTVMSSLDTTIANVALPTIARDVNATAAASIWVVNAYQLAITTSLLSFASLGDIFGYARVYRIALGMFVVASALCALSHSLVTLTAARVVQGFAAAAQMAVSPAVTRSLYPRAQLGRAISNNALAVSISAAAGPMVAGAILSVAPWPYLFIINIPTGLAAFLLASRFLPSLSGIRHRFDVPSSILGALTFGLLVVAIDGFGHGMSRTLNGIELAGGIGFGFIFLRRQFMLDAPMLAIELFRRPIFSLSVGASFSSFIAQTIAVVTLPFYFEDVLGFSAVTTGLLMTPWPLASMLVAKPAGRLADRYPAGILSTIGMAIVIVGLYLLVCLPAAPAPADIAWRMFVCGIGTGIFLPPNGRAILGNAPVERGGAASGIQAMTRVTGQTTGAALVALVFGVFEHGRHANQNGVVVTLIVAIALSFASALTSSLRLTPFARPRPA